MRIRRIALTIAIGALVSGCAALAWERSRVDARVAFSQERYCEAEQAFKAAVAKAEAFGERDPRLAETLKEFGILYIPAQRPDLVEPLWARALAIQESALPAGDPQTAETVYRLGEVYRYTKRYGEAEQAHRRALAMREKAFVDRELHLVAESADALGMTYLAQEKFREAEPLFRRAIRIWSGVYSPPNEAEARVNLGRILTATGRAADALPLYQTALATLETNQGWHAGQASVALSARFETLITQRDLQRLSFGWPTPPFPSLVLPAALESYSQALRALGRTADADAAATKAAERRAELERLLAKRRAELPAKLPPC